MTNIWTSGMEGASLAAEGLTGFGTNPTLSTTQKHAGSKSMVCSAAAVSYAYRSGIFTNNRPYFGRIWIYMPTAPPADLVVAEWADGSAVAQYNVLMKTDRTCVLRYGTTVVGSPSAALALGEWHSLALSEQNNTAGNDSATLKVNGITVATDSGNSRFANGVTFWAFGFITSPGTSWTAYFDDEKVNDDQGAAPDNTWPAQGTVLDAAAVTAGSTVAAVCKRQRLGAAAITASSVVASVGTEISGTPAGAITASSTVTCTANPQRKGAAAVSATSSCSASGGYVLIVTELDIHGHSLAHGDISTTPGANGTGSMQQLDAALGLTEHTYAESSSQILYPGNQATADGLHTMDAWGVILNKQTRNSSKLGLGLPRMTVIWHGANDMTLAGVSTAATFLKDCCRAVIANFRQNKRYQDSDASCSYGTGWASTTPTTNFCAGTTVRRKASGTEAITITVPSTFEGGELNFGFVTGIGRGAVVTFTYDGGSTGNGGTLEARGATVGVINEMCLVHRITGLAPGAHTIVITAASYAGSGIDFDYWAIVPSVPSPILIIKQYHTRSQASYQDAEMDSLNTMWDDLIAEFDGTGRYIRGVDTEAVIAKNAAYFYIDDVHLNQAGHDQVYAAALPQAKALVGVTQLGAEITAATSSVAAVAHKTAVGACAITVSSTVATVGRATKVGAAAMSAGSTVAAVPKTVRTTAAAVSGSTTVASVCHATRAGQAPSSASSTVACAAAVTRLGAASVSAVATVACSGNSVPSGIQIGSAHVLAGSTVAADAHRMRASAASVTALSSCGGVPHPERYGRVAISASAAVTCSAGRTSTAFLEISAHSGLSSTAIRTRTSGSEIVAQSLCVGEAAGTATHGQAVITIASIVQAIAQREIGFPSDEYELDPFDQRFKPAWPGQSFEPNDLIELVGSDGLVAQQAGRTLLWDNEKQQAYWARRKETNAG